MGKEGQKLHSSDTAAVEKPLTKQRKTKHDNICDHFCDLPMNTSNTSRPTDA